MCLSVLVITVLQQPLFSNATYTANEGELLNINCVSRNIPDITTVQILNPNGVRVPTNLGVYSVPNVRRSYAGIYTCVVTSTRDYSTVNDTSLVIVECKIMYSFITTRHAISMTLYIKSIIIMARSITNVIDLLATNAMYVSTGTHSK